MTNKINRLLSKKDFVLVASLTLIYALIALYNLGSLKAPETFWQPRERGESFIVDIGKDELIERICFFGGLGKGSYSAAFSKDRNVWSDRMTIPCKEIFTWNYIEPKLHAQYIKITAEQQGTMLNEIGFFAADSTNPLKIKAILPNGNTFSMEKSPACLFDEQHTVAWRPSYYNGMYFDEVYHARTAYEHINKLEPYEWTHPPLGKLFIALGIKVFGMNPFGWRIIGTIFGIMMIPLMFLFGKRLFKKTEYAFISAFLMSFDFMHFTQTRIATIDVYGVFFIILMYYFMYRYYKIDVFSTSFVRTLIPLGLSGLFFGIGAACKWIVLYGGIGLAVLFFISIYRQYVAYRCNQNSLRTYRQDAIISFPRHVTRTIAWSIVFFIIIPAIIYCLSYIPFMLVNRDMNGLKLVGWYQKQMYIYHKNVNEAHPFTSPWWEWPIMRKPMWYYSGQDELPAGAVSSIVAMGNPAVWWTGIVAIPVIVFIYVLQRDKKAFFILIAFATQYLPWVIAPRRVVFIYHYFASVPFVIFGITYMLMYLRERKKFRQYVIGGYLVLTVGLFILFYPVISGRIVPQVYVAAFLRWFPTWYFYS